MRFTDAGFEVAVADVGSPFDPTPYFAHTPDFTAERGRGLWLIYQVAEAVHVERDLGGNRLVMTFGSRAEHVTVEAAEAFPVERPGWISTLGAVDVLGATGAAAVAIDAGLVVIDAVGAVQKMLGIDRSEIVGRDARAVAAAVKTQFGDPSRYETQVLDEFAHWEQRSDDVIIMADGRLVRRVSSPVAADDGSPARLTIYLPLPHQTELVGGMQRALLPDVPTWADIDVGAIYHPAEASSFVGGDFFDFLTLSSGNRCVVIGDVSGRGYTAAATSTKVRAYLRASLAAHGLTAAIPSLEAMLQQEFQPEEFVTLTLLAEESPHVWTLTNCGHESALLLRAGAVTELSARGPLLGMDIRGTWVRQPFSLRSGDALLLYTDGITDAGRHANRFGVERLAEALTDVGDLPAQELVETIDRRVHDFGYGDIQDDHVLVALKVR